MKTIGEVDSKGHLVLREDPVAWIKNNPASRLALVTSLRLFSSEMEEIGEFIGELTQLIRLEFCICRSLKCVPANIGQLVSLTHLVLCYCDNIKFLPDSIVNLSNLTSLTLSYCKSLVELPENIGQLASLTHLMLDFCDNIKSLPTSIANLPKLTSLFLSSELPSNLGHLKKCLSHLSLRGCDWEELPATVCQLGSLTHLDLFICKNIKFLPNSIANLSKLTILSLTSCGSLVELPANIGQLVSLTHLKLYNCKNIKSLLMSIANLSKLTSLYLENCDFLTELPSNLGQIKSRSHLQLDSCNNIKSLPDSMKDLCSLDTLFIDNCNSLTQLPINLNVLHLKLIDCCPHFLPTGLINLKYLRVTVCSCSDESFANWKVPYSLQHLSISGCVNHNNYNIIKVPACLNQFVNLQVLSLHDPISFVELPANLDGLAHLCLLDIRFSSIKCLPWSITKLRKLQHLMLPEDFILETLPYELNNSVIISVEKRHVRKSWEELKTEIGELPIPFGGEIGDDAAQNPSIISPPGYLRLKEVDPSQWIINNRNLLMLVRFLDLEYVEELTDSIMQFSELTHLYLYIIDDICLPDNYFVTFTRLTHLSLGFSEVEIDESVIHSLSKLSNLQTLHLRSLGSELPENFNMPVSLKHLSLSSCNMRPLYDSLEKLTNLRSLDLDSCKYCESLPPCMYIHKLRLVDCSFESLYSLPIGLHHLEILFSEDYNDLRCIFEKCWNQLVNLETLSITCFEMDFFPEDIARLHNLQKLQLKDCISLKKLPSNLHELVNLHTLDISVTRIKTLPLSFVKQCKLQHLTLPKCFNMQSLPGILKMVSIIDDTEEAYCKCMGYDASLYQTSADIYDESKDEETELGVVPGESCNEDNYLVPTVENHESVPDEQTSADPFNSISMGSIEHITTEQGGISQIYKDSHFNVSKDPIDENIQHTSQNQFNPLGNGGFMTNRPGADLFGVNNQYVINDGQFDNMTLENEHGTASICQNISSWDGNSIVGGWNNHHALDLGHNNNSQSYHANVIRQEKEITPEAILEPLPRFVNAAEKHDDLSYNKGETSNPSGESSHAVQNTITTETEIDCGEINHHALESEQNHIPQSNNVRVKMNSNNITLKMLQSFWSNHTKLEDAADELGVSRSTLKRRIKELDVKWPRKGKKQQLDTKKRKHNNKAPFESDCSQQNLVNLGSSAAHAENVECIMGSDLHSLPNHVSSNSNGVINLTPDATMETIRGNLMETIDSHQGAEVHLNGATERTLSDTLPQNEKSSNFIVKAYYNVDIVRFDFSLSKSIDQLKEEIANKLELEVNTFKIKYKDEEKEKVTVTHISDLEHALNLSRSSNNSSVVRLFIFPKT